MSLPLFSEQNLGEFPDKWVKQSTILVGWTNQFPQSISLTTKTSVYHLVAPTHSGEMSINKVREAAREGTNQHSDIYICIYTYIYIYIYIPIRVSGGLRFAKIVVCEWPRRGKGKQCVVAQCQVIQSIDSGTVNVAAVCLVHLSSCALAPSMIAWADCLQSECAGHPTACASRGVAQCVYFFGSPPRVLF